MCIHVYFLQLEIVMDLKQSVSMDTILMMHLECSAIDRMISVITPLIARIEVMKAVVMKCAKVMRLDVLQGKIKFGLTC